MWIFGYGSLIWKAGFPFEERRPACVRGWARRFWQESADHRGVPGAPGRVVTLVHAPDEVWGVAYRLASDAAPGIIAELDHREKGGYGRYPAPIFDKSGTTIAADATVYIGDECHPRFAGETSVDAIAAIIVSAEGPSGHNVEYLLRLAESLRRIDASDPHVSAIVGHVDRLAGTQLRARFAHLFP